MGTILDQLANHARERVAQAKQALPLDALREQALALPRGDFAFERALRKPELSFICECKKASPSKGLIAPDFPYLQIAREYDQAGADAISVLTEPKWFLGSDRYLEEIAAAVSVPCLRKDFTVDEYMIYQAKLLGASAVLLICAILSPAQLESYLALCGSLGLSALVEAHDEAEAQMAVRAGARIIGVNNRNLKDFSVDPDNSRRLRACIPSEVLFISESGIQSPEDVAEIRKLGADGVLIGETLMRASDKTAMLARASGDTMTKIKLCGLTRAEDIGWANRLCPDYIGFVFVPSSRRYVSPERAAALKARLSPDISAVGVFVREDPAQVARLLKDGIIDIAQLHGGESPEYLRQLREKTSCPIWQAFRVQTADDLTAAQDSAADHILLDSGGGGTGTVFDWSLLSNIRRPYFLAGGLTPENAGPAIRRLRPYGVDVSSGIETNGTKDPAKMAAFVAAVRKEEQL